MSGTFNQVIGNFLSGAMENDEGSVSTTGTLRIKGDQLIHYSTPIAERYNDCVIVNITRYSLATGKLQKQLKEVIPEGKYVQVRGIREGSKDSLAEYLSPEDKERGKYCE